MSLLSPDSENIIFIENGICESSATSHEIISSKHRGKHFA